LSSHFAPLLVVVSDFTFCLLVLVKWLGSASFAFGGGFGDFGVALFVNQTTLVHTAAAVEMGAERGAQPFRCLYQ
jgi:hypothetical protein